MTIVNSKKEFEQALKSKETEILVTNKKFLIELYVASKIKDFSPNLPVESLEHNVCAAVSPEILKLGIITVAVCVSALTIVAMIKGYNVEIEVDFKSRKGKIDYNK